MKTERIDKYNIEIITKIADTNYCKNEIWFGANVEIIIDSDFVVGDHRKYPLGTFKYANRFWVPKPFIQGIVMFGGQSPMNGIDMDYKLHILHYEMTRRVQGMAYGNVFEASEGIHYVGKGIRESHADQIPGIRESHADQIPE